MAIKDKLYYTNLLSHDPKDHVVARYPYTDAGALTLAAAAVGDLVKFSAAGTEVLGALAADDAVLGGVIGDLPAPDDVPAAGKTKTVLVILQGSLSKHAVTYADGSGPLSVAAIQRLRTIGIFVFDVVPTGPFAP